MLAFTAALQGSVAERLREARKSIGMSTREVAGIMQGRFPISHATIANYEKGRSHPTVPVLAALAEIYERPLNWFLEAGPTLRGIRYRNLPSKVRQPEKYRYEAESLRWLDGYLKIEELLGKQLKPSQTRPPASSPPKSAAVNPAEFAQQIRAQLQIGPDAPVPSVIDAMEAFGIRVIEVPTALRIDGLAAMMDDKPVVVLNPARPDDRIRLNATHEFFHQLLGHCCDGMKPSNPDQLKGDEDLAFACARNFLLPESQLRNAFSGQSFVRLVKFKEKFRISIAAMIYAAHQERILNDATARFLWIEISRRGWRVNEPGTVRPDRATRFEQLIDEAMSREKVTLNRVAQLIGVPEKELSARLRLAQGIVDQPDHQPLGQEGDEPGFYGLRLAK